MLRILFVFQLLFMSQLSDAFTYDLEITEAELQEKLEAMMPLEKKKLFFKTIVTDPKVKLISASNEIAIYANVAAHAPGGLTLTGSTQLQGSLRYDAEKGAFYFDNAKVKHLKIDQLPEQFAPKVKELTQTAVTNGTGRRPVYVLNDDNLKQKLAKSVLKSVLVKGSSLIVTLSAF